MMHNIISTMTVQASIIFTSSHNHAAWKIELRYYSMLQ